MNQPTLLLHHYPMSPFAEKIRLILAFKGLSWSAVVAANMMPKPNLQALTGGYRRIPVLQIGADIYCDTALIADVLDQIAPTPTLYPDGADGVARVIAQWADAQLFTTAMAYNFQPAAIANIFPNHTAEQIKAFADDRAQMRGGAPRMHVSDAAPSYREYLRRIESMLGRHDFVAGARPNIADFACYHPLWFTQQVAKLTDTFAETPRVEAWLQRLAAMAKPAAGELTDVQAIAIAASATPAAITDQPAAATDGIALGAEVSIRAESFGLEDTVGRLVGCNANRYTLERTDTRAGTVHVHFPRLGFQLRALGKQ